MKKPKVLYILTILNSIYLSYLICRINSNSIIANAFILIFVLLLGLFLTNKWLKNYDIKKIKSSRIKIIVTTLLCSTVIFCVGFKFFCSNIKPTEVTFERQTDLFQYINNIEVDNIIYNYNDNCFTETHEMYCTDKLKLITDDNYTKIAFEKAYNIKINFNENAKDLIIINNDKKIEVDENSYIITSNYNYSISSFIMGFLSFELVNYIFSLVISAILCVNHCKKYLIILTLFSLTIGILNIRCSELGLLTNDSPSYVKYIFHNFFHLIFSDRTPIYPFIIRIIRLLFVDNYLIWVCLFQYFIWIISIIFLYKTLCMLVDNRLSFLACILYIMSNAIIGWNNVILTESIAISGTVIVIYNIIKYIKYHNLKNGLFAVLLSLILTFVRPTSLILVVGLCIFWIARFIFERENLKNDLICFLFSLMSIVIIIIYAIIFHATYKIYSITSVIVRQDLYVNIQEGFYTSSSNKEFVDFIKGELKNNNGDLWEIVTKVQSKYDTKQLSLINKECRNKNISQYFEYILRLIKENSDIAFSSYSSYNTDKLFLISTNSLNSTFCLLTFLGSYIMILIEVISGFYLWIKNKKVPWVDFGLSAFVFIIIISTFIGTNAEFMRTAICVVPFTYISYTLLLARFLGLKVDDNSKKIKKFIK